MAITAWSANVSLVRSAFRKRLDVASGDGHDADRTALAQQWDAEHCAVATERCARQWSYSGSARHPECVSTLHSSALDRDSASSRGMGVVAIFSMRAVGGIPVARRDAIEVAITREMSFCSASHSRAADWTRVSSTVCRSNVERLITLSTSAVAVCCCSDSAQLVQEPRVLDGDHRLGGEL